MIVWGGYKGNSQVHNDGGRYDPQTDAWSSISAIGAPSARGRHTAVWTGSEMIVFGGVYSYLSVAEGGSRYNPTTNTWTLLSSTNAPQGRYRHTAVWTGSEMIVWGGSTISTGYYAKNYGRYNPSANEGNGAWVTLDSNSGPAAREDHKAIWTGSEMIVYGGFNVDNLLLGNGRYNPTIGLWTGVSTTGAPKARGGYTTIWTGSEMILYGGFSGSSYFREVSSYKPGRQMYLYQRPCRWCGACLA
jgi:N-acetylneuraminic acid mutarotase